MGGEGDGIAVIPDPSGNVGHMAGAGIGKFARDPTVRKILAQDMVDRGACVLEQVVMQDDMTHPQSAPCGEQIGSLKCGSHMLATAFE